MRKGLSMISACIMLLALCGCGGFNANTTAPGTQLNTGIENTEGGETMDLYDFSIFNNVAINGVDLRSFDEEQLAVLFTQARYCQAMTDSDIDAMRELVSEDKVFTHMSGKQQTREEYFADVANGSLTYFTIGIENPAIDVRGSHARLTYTAVLNADAYGARGTFRMDSIHAYEKRDGQWIEVND